MLGTWLNQRLHTRIVRVGVLATEPLRVVPAPSLPFAIARGLALALPFLAGPVKSPDSSLSSSHGVSAAAARRMPRGQPKDSVSSNEAVIS